MSIQAEDTEERVQNATTERLPANPHCSRRFLLQPSIRRFDKPDGGRARSSDPQRTARVRIGASRLRALVSLGVSAVSSRTLMNNAG
jgi:hypothetical protein